MILRHLSFQANLSLPQVLCGVGACVACTSEASCPEGAWGPCSALLTLVMSPLGLHEVHLMLGVVL